MNWASSKQSEKKKRNHQKALPSSYATGEFVAKNLILKFTWTRIIISTRKEGTQQCQWLNKRNEETRWLLFNIGSFAVAEAGDSDEPNDRLRTGDASVPAL
jgi:hypothetical protein